MKSLFAATVLGILLAGCATAPAQQPTLYQQMGGQGGLETITDGFLNYLATDVRIAHFFSDTDIPKFRDLLLKQFCVLAGGPCKYEGKDMKEAHDKKHISDADFNALVEDLQKAMNDAHVAIPVQDRFLATLVPLQRDIVYR